MIRAIGRCLLALSCAVLGLLGVTGNAWANFSALGEGTGSALVGTLAAPTNVTATQPDSNVAALEVSWVDSPDPAGATLGGYYVQRFTGTDTTPAAACGTSAQDLLPQGTTTCSDSGLAVGSSYRYQLVAVFRSWTATSPSSLAVTVIAPQLNGFTVDPSTAFPIAGSLFTANLTAVDQDGNAVTGYTGAKCVTFSGPASGPDGTAASYPAQGICSSGSSVAFSAGHASVDITLYDAQTVELTVTDNVTSQSGATNLTVGAATADTFVLAAATTTLTAGAADDLTVTARDVYGNTATSYAGAQSLTFGGATAIGSNSPTVSNSAGTPVAFGASTAISFVAGVSSVTGSANGVMKLYRAGAAGITATDGSISSSAALAVTVTAAAAGNFVLAAATVTPIAGAANNLTITARDVYGNTATSYTGAQSLTFGGATAIGPNNPTVSNSAGTAIAFGAATGITFSSGVATVSGVNNGVMKLYKAGAASITASDGTISTGSALTVTVNAGPGATLVVNAATTTLTAGAADNLTVTARDVYGNTATSYTGAQSLTFGGATAIGSNSPTVSNSAGTPVAFGASTAISFVAGVSSVTGSANGVMKLYRAGAAGITATDGSISSSAALAVTVNAAAAGNFVLAAATVTPTAGAANNLTITARDVYGNTATSYTGAHSLTFGGATAIGPNNPTVSNSAGTAIAFGAATGITFSSGVATVSGASNGVMRLYKAGAASITASDGTISTVTGLAMTVSPAPWQLNWTNPNACLVLANGATCTTTVTLITTDAYGNTYSGPPISLTLNLASAKDFSVAAGTGSSSGQATAIITATGSVSGAFAVTRTSPGNGKNTTLSVTAPGFTSPTPMNINTG